ncbi:MAG: methylmalonyl-CoA mutase family protein [Polyangiaceae bacterium]
MEVDPRDLENTLSHWRAEVAKVLRKMGKLAPDDARPDPEQLIATRTYDGIVVEPLYTTAHASTELASGTKPARQVELGWDVRALHEALDQADPSAEALLDLENGANSLWLRMGAQALPLGSLGKVLSKVLLDLAPVALDAGEHAVAAAEELFAVHEARGVDRGAVLGSLGADPWGLLARSGHVIDMGEVVALAVRASARYPKLSTFTVDATVYHDAGASDAQELGFSLAIGVDYLRHLTKAGLDERVAARQLEFRYAATVDQFGTLAKFRAARIAWARVLSACGIASAPSQTQHAVTSSAMMTQRDPWVNMLRTTVAAFAAGTAGATAVTVLPFDRAIGVSDAFARRMARASQALLLEEANVGRVRDPAGGSFYVEALTRDVANAAWNVFRDIERAGGWKAAWEAGAVRSSIESQRAARQKNVARRKDPITGVSEFPDLHEKKVARPSAPAPAKESSALPEARRAAPFEALRDRSDAALAKSGARPSVFLVALGTIAAHTARATFISNLLQAGGIEPRLSPPIHDEAALKSALAQAGKVPVACICGTDAAYKENASWLVPSLRASGVSHVILAGKKDALEGTGATVDESIAAGCDALAVLEQLLTRIEVP